MPPSKQGPTSSSILELTSATGSAPSSVLHASPPPSQHAPHHLTQMTTLQTGPTQHSPSHHQIPPQWFHGQSGANVPLHRPPRVLSDKERRQRELRRLHKVKKFVKSLPKVDIATIDRNDIRCAFCWFDFDEKSDLLDPEKAAYTLAGVRSNEPVKLPCGHMLGESCLIESMMSDVRCLKCRRDLIKDDWDFVDGEYFVQSESDDEYDTAEEDGEEDEDEDKP